MVFSSVLFLFGFLPAVYLLYVLIPSHSLRNALLIIASLVFYAYGEPVYILLMLASIVANYLFGLWIGAEKCRRAAMVLAVVFNISLLAVFKYADMLIGWCNSLFSTSLPLPQIALPVGISFFTFQALSYVIDVWRREVPAQKNLFSIMLYISFFPQLIAGPIVKYHDIQSEIDSRSISWDLSARGLRRFSVGLAKKVMIANALAYVTDSLYALGAENLAAPAAWALALCYLFQIYFDFSGYSDMAIGLGWMFGFHFKENFNYPYISLSIQEFWRRWHISLSTWFREYLYIPLGGNRKGMVRTSINKMIVFLCTGLWHGASLNFLFWGFWHGFFILLEQWLPPNRIPKPLRWLGTMLIVLLGFVIFRADTLNEGFAIIGQMLGGWNLSGQTYSLSVLRTLCTPVALLAFTAAVIGSMPVRSYFEAMDLRLRLLPGYTLSLLLLAVCGLMIAGGGYNPFIYFRF